MSARTGTIGRRRTGGGMGQRRVGRLRTSRWSRAAATAVCHGPCHASRHHRSADREQGTPPYQHLTAEQWPIGYRAGLRNGPAGANSGLIVAIAGGGSPRRYHRYGITDWRFEIREIRPLFERWLSRPLYFRPLGRPPQAAMRRRVRSSNSGHTALNFVVSLARPSTRRQHSTNSIDVLILFSYAA